MPSYPEEIDGYEIIEAKIGKGGFAVVHKAICDAGVVALKVPKYDEDAGTIDLCLYDRLYAEAELWYKLSKKDVPGVVKLYAFGSKPYPWMAVEYMPGGSLKERIGRLDIDESLMIACEVLRSLYYSHHLGVIHRDIKPANILFDMQGEAHLTDWGLGKIMLNLEDEVTGGYKGTLRYSAPEQFDARDDVDWRTDIFQVGAVLYHMITGEPPLPADFFEAMTTVFKGGIKDIRDLEPGLPEEVAAAVMKALAVEKRDRWENASQFIHALEAQIRTTCKRVTKDIKQSPVEKSSEDTGGPYSQATDQMERCRTCNNFITIQNRKLRCKACDTYLCETCENWINKEETYLGVRVWLRYPLCEACYKKELARRKKEIDESLESLRARFREILNELAGTLRAYFLDEQFVLIEDLPVTQLADRIQKTGERVDSVVFDGIISQHILDLARKYRIRNMIGVRVGNLMNRYPEIRIFDQKSLEGGGDLNTEDSWAEQEHKAR